MTSLSYNPWLVLLVMALSLGFVSTEDEVEYKLEYAGYLTGLPSDIPLNVTMIVINACKMPEIRPYAFSSYTRLTSLSLTNNQISYIAPEAFNETLIEKLGLTSNQLNVSSLVSLKQISHSLKVLNLDNNPINVSDEMWLTVMQNLTALSKITLKSSFLTSFPMFPSSLNLRVLNLLKNKIAVVEKKKLMMVPESRWVTLNSNEITTFPDIRDSKINKLELTDNPLVCDERLAWMKRLQCVNMNIRLDPTPCTAPSHLVGVPWENIAYADLNPEEPTAILFDKKNSTCIDTSDDLDVFFRKIPLGHLPCQIKISVVGSNLECLDDGRSSGLLFSVNNDSPKDACGVKYKRCELKQSEPTLCEYDCDCLANNGGCREGLMYWPRPDPRASICEVSIVKA